ncbi:class II aldolase/adducin family protein [Frankia sp. AiPs1]|uniref:class II aldolase/adducin family protein n=1 Tax=Frankia sp. AiPs1 TaxID=573493 RepID=UPI0020430F3A|nr:class II aldolase/adducin family protein [Frankia sp. AiPs1]MCM3925688.1 class II aldolase/adducin family protein [Frankia sp. AiPs1]
MSLHPSCLDVATACRVLAADGQDHFCFGHVSVRMPHGGLLVKTAGASLARVGPGHVAEVGPDGAARTLGLRLHEETALHRAVYAHRDDVGAVVHTHPLAAQTATLFPPMSGGILSQDEVPFAAGVAWYDDADLVADAGRGRAFARCLGSDRAALLRAHGLVTVGRDIVEATALALLLHRALVIRLAAMAVGRPRPIDPVTVARLSSAFEAGHAGRMAAIWADAVAALDLPWSAALGPGGLRPVQPGDDVAVRGSYVRVDGVAEPGS